MPTPKGMSQGRYPWREWFSKATGPFMLRSGKEYHCSTFAMFINIKRAAVREGYRVLCQQRDDHVIVTVIGRRPAVRKGKPRRQPRMRKPPIQMEVHRKGA